MSDPLASRFDFLRAAQNPDGGWGFFPGKQSWLEPTVYALLAFWQQAPSGPEFTRGWRLLRSWQLPSGGWRASAAIEQPHWATSLAVTLHGAMDLHDALTQISEIRRQVARTEVFRGYRAVPVAFSGFLAIVVAVGEFRLTVDASKSVPIFTGHRSPPH